jgi:hypothetical protein
MGGALPGKLGMIGLGNQDERPIRPFAYDHCFCPGKVGCVDAFVVLLSIYGARP